MANKTGWIVLVVLLLQSLSIKAFDLVDHNYLNRSEGSDTHPAITTSENDSDTLMLESLPQRFSIEVAQQLKVALCGLEKEVVYQLFFNKDLTNLSCTPSINCMDGHADHLTWLGDRSFQVKAQSECLQMMVLVDPCPATFPITLSVGQVADGSPAEETPKSVVSIETDDTYTPQQLVEDVFVGGDCFEVVGGSIDYTGEPQSVGYFFNGNTSINMEDGVVISSGNIADSAGPNDFYNAGSQTSGSSSDPDLADLLTGSNSLFDVTALEFDFIPTTDNVSFEFVFASEEYCEYVGSTFNDVFGFFISGPGINGPFSNNAANIALIPGTNAYMAINSVNYLDNANYYVNNIPAGQLDNLPGSLDCPNHPTTNGAATDDIEFDGFTTVLTAQAAVQPCETYHIKLVIADVGDAYFDSAVFLKANSFDAGGNATVGVQSPDADAPNTVYENCVAPGYFVFTRSGDDLSQPLEVVFNVAPQSTATEGTDYAPLPGSVTIPAGESEFLLPVEVFNDLLVEGNETIILELETSCSCETPFIEMLIADQEPLEVSLVGDTLCNTAPVTLTPQVSGGLPGYEYLWSTGATSSSLNLNPTSSATYSLTVTDGCGTEMITSAEVVVTPAPTATLSGDEQICPGGTAAQLQVDFTGNGPWEISYTIDNNAPVVIDNITQNPFTFPTNTVGTYLLTAVAENGCGGTVSGTATVTEVSLDLSSSSTLVTCPGWNDGSITVSVNAGIAPFTYVWDQPWVSGPSPTNLPEGTYNLTVTDGGGCSGTLTETVGLEPSVPEAAVGPAEDFTCVVTQLTLDGSGSTGTNFSLEWSTPDGNILSGSNGFNPVVDQGGTYTLVVTNDLTGCTQTDAVMVGYDTILPTPQIVLQGPLMLDCNDPTTVIDGSSSQPFGQLTFAWSTLDGNIAPGEEVLPAFEVNTAGNYILEVTDIGNGCSQTADITIEQNEDLPVIDIQTPLPLTCIQTEVALDATASSTGPDFTYEWTTPDGNFVSGQDGLSPVVDVPGTYVLTIFNMANGCDQSAETVVVEDVELPAADAGIASDDLDCNTTTLTLDGTASSSGNGYAYSWTTSDGNIVDGSSTPTPTVDMAGVYTLLVINQSNGCEATDEVVVHQNGAMPEELLLEVISPVCFGDKGGVSVVGVIGGQPPYLFSTNGGGPFYADSLFMGLAPGEQQMVVQDANGCQYQQSFYIPSVLPVTVELEAEVTIQLGETYQLNAMTNVPANLIDTIMWTPDESLSCANCLDPEARPVDNTVYHVMLFDKNGCFAEDELLLRVQKDRDVFIPNAFSPNGDGRNDVFMIFANPEVVKSVNQFQLFNRWGEKVFERTEFMPNDPVNGWDGSLDGKQMNPGVFVFFAEIEFIDGYREMYKGDFSLLR